MTKETPVILEIIGEVLVACTGDGRINDEDFNKMLTAIRTPGVTKCLALGLGSTEVTSVQRKQVVDVSRNKGLFTVTVTDDRLTRGLVTAAGWLGASITACSWAELRSGIQMFKLPSVMEQRVFDRATALREEFTQIAKKRS